MPEDDKPRVEKLLDALRDVRQTANELAAEVSKALRADRQVGRTAGDRSAGADSRRRKRNRRKTQGR